MLVHAVHFPITKIQEPTFEGHLRKESEWKFACASPQDLLCIQKRIADQGINIKKTTQRPIYHTNTHTCMYTLYMQTQIHHFLVSSTAPGHGVLHDTVPPHPQNREEVWCLALRESTQWRGAPLPDGIKLWFQHPCSPDLVTLQLL